ncbi:MAG: hypothetical protein AB9842_08065 [Bacteroidales bacterium]
MCIENPTPQIRMIDGVPFNDELVEAIRRIIEEEFILEKYHSINEAGLILAALNYPELGIHDSVFDTLRDIGRIYKALLKVKDIN